MFEKILIVCVGNICRSPMAEALMRNGLSEAGNTETIVQSAGVGALVGQHTDDKAKTLLLEKGIDVSRHVARQLNQSLVNWADLVLVMERSQLDEIQHQHPTARGKVFLLGHWSETEIRDPYMQDFSAFQTAFEQIEQAVQEWSAKIVNS